MLTWDKTIFDEMYQAQAWPVMRGYPLIPNIFFHYQWTAQRRRLDRLAGHLTAHPRLRGMNNTAIIGGGFGWSSEALQARGVRAFSVDPSTYIISTQDQSEEGDLREYLTQAGFDADRLAVSGCFVDLTDRETTIRSDSSLWARWLRPDGKRTSIPVEQEDLQTRGSRRRVVNRANGLQAIISEDCISATSDDTEALSIVEACERLKPRTDTPVVHICSLRIDQEGVKHDPRLNWHSLEEWRVLLDEAGFENHTIMSPSGESI